MQLYLIRHAHAGQGNPDDPHDSLRPLSLKGQAQARTLTRACAVLGVRFDSLFSSPYTRALETAEPLVIHTKRSRLEPLSELTTDAYADLVTVLQRTVLQRTVKSGDSSLGLVGHEPYLSELARFLLTGEAGALSFRFRKGMMLEPSGPLCPGSLELQRALTPKRLEKFAP